MLLNLQITLDLNAVFVFITSTEFTLEGSDGYYFWLVIWIDDGDCNFLAISILVLDFKIVRVESENG